MTLFCYLQKMCNIFPFGLFSEVATYQESKGKYAFSKKTVFRYIKFVSEKVVSSLKSPELVTQFLELKKP